MILGTRFEAIGSYYGLHFFKEYDARLTDL